MAVPSLRFKEFEEKYILRKGDDVFKRVSSGKSKAEDNGTHDLYGSTGIIGKTNNALGCSSYLLIARVGANAGQLNLVEGDIGVTDNTLIAEPESDIEIMYIYLWLQQFNLNRLIFGSGQPLITGGLIKNLKLNLPSLPEQRKIADFLSAVDEKIRLLTEKKEKLETYKKGVMQKLFPKQGQTNPELRFKRPDGSAFPDWELTKGERVFKSHSNKNHNGDLPVLSASQERGMILRDEGGIQIQSSEASVKSYKIVEPGDFVISLRSFQGGLEYSEIKGICSPAYIILKPKEEISDRFFKHYFKKDSFIERLSKTVVGIRDGKQISYDAFGGVKLNVPCVEEQKSIGDFLDTVDSRIEMSQAEIDQMKYFKKGLLQQMFV